MLSFSPSDNLGFHGYLLDTNNIQERYYYKSLEHYLECEKFSFVNNEYYYYLNSLEDMSLLLLETRGVSAQHINTNYSEELPRIILCGIHFLVQQHPHYFNAFIEYEEDIVCPNTDIQDLFIYYRKRYALAKDTVRTAILGDFNVSKKTTFFQRLSEKFELSAPEELIIIDLPGISSLVSDFAWMNRLPFTVIHYEKSQSTKALPPLLDRLSEYSSTGVIVSASNTHHKILQYFNNKMTALNKPILTVLLNK